MPAPQYCSIPSVAVGTVSGAALVEGFHVSIRDQENQPLVSSVVALRFEGAAEIFVPQSSPAFAYCDRGWIYCVTDVTGTAVIYLRFGGYENSDSILVTADGIILGYIQARSTDLNRDGSVGLSDLAMLQANLFNNPAAQETDFSLNGVTDMADLSILQSDLVASGGETASTCP